MWNLISLNQDLNSSKQVHCVRLELLLHEYLQYLFLKRNRLKPNIVYIYVWEVKPFYYH